MDVKIWATGIWSKCDWQHAGAARRDVVILANGGTAIWCCSGSYSALWYNGPTRGFADRACIAHQ